MEQDNILGDPSQIPEDILYGHYGGQFLQQNIDSESSSESEDETTSQVKTPPKSSQQSDKVSNNYIGTSRDSNATDPQISQDSNPWDYLIVKTEPAEEQEESSQQTPSSSLQSWKEEAKAGEAFKVKSEVLDQNVAIECSFDNKWGGIGQPIKVENEYVTCHLCSKSIKPRYMKVHLGRGNCNPPLNCDICNKTFSSFQKLKKHQKIHTGNRENKHLCNYCPKTFYEAYNLKVHTRIHTGEKPFQCEYCAKTFTERGQLKMHTYVHSGLRERTYVCDLCPKSFYKTTNLFAHKRTHSGEKPFSCEHCGRLFSEMGNMKKHVEKFHSKPTESETEQQIVSHV